MARSRIIAVLVILCIVVPFPGCSISKAINQPPPIDFTNVKVGTTRSDLIAALGSPKHTDVTDTERADVFEFIDGFPSASKMRVVLYAAADVFTLALAELILWPLESATMDGKPGKAIATYDANNVVKTLKVTDRQGKPWETSNSAGN